MATIEHIDPRLGELLERLPREPGVYLLKNRADEIIYVGKAKNLFLRVRSYFTRSGDTRAFVALLSRILGDVETIVTNNEKEALLLENNLIKKHRPRFNVMLRDDKNYLVLRLDSKKRYPRLEVKRQIGSDGARHFGPYHSASSCRQTLRVVNRYFQLRTCTDRTMASRTRPCLQYQIDRCPAPCVIDVDLEEYKRHVEDVTLFLRGQQEALVVGLNQRMHAAAEELNFKIAAHVRDQIAAVEKSLIGQQVVGAPRLDQDIFGFHREGDAVDIVVLKLRGGKLMGRRPFSYSGQEFPDEELLSSFVGQYYDDGESVPVQVLLPSAIDDAETKARWLSELRGGKVEVLAPQRGQRRKLLELAERNAQANFRSRRKRDEDLEQALAKLQRRLRLSRLPRHIECYDISSIGGQLMVASMVVMRDGLPRTSDYRHFKIRLDAGQTGDDFASMYQVLARRLRRAKAKEAGWELPELIVVDGGKGQLSVALAALRDAAFASDVELPEMIGLAKERSENLAPGQDADDDAPKRSERSRPDRVFLAQVKDPIRLRPNTAELYLLSRIRDEAHRFAITYHKKLRRQRTLKSGLDDIPGIGKKRKRELLRAFGSLRRLGQASYEQIVAVPSMTSAAAEAVVDYFVAATDSPSFSKDEQSPKEVPSPSSDRS